MILKNTREELSKYFKNPLKAVHKNTGKAFDCTIGDSGRVDYLNLYHNFNLYENRCENTDKSIPFKYRYRFLIKPMEGIFFR